MSEEEMKKEAAKRGITVSELKMLLGNGAATKAALTLKDRKSQLDKMIDG